VGDVHETPLRLLAVVARPAFGLGTTDHFVPFHDSANVLICTLSIGSRNPTAVQAAADTHDTLASSSNRDPGPSGLGTTDQLGGWLSAGAVIASTNPLASAPATRGRAIRAATRPAPGASRRQPKPANPMCHLVCCRYRNSTALGAAQSRTRTSNTLPDEVIVTSTASPR
jgi:hypothetical protein